MIVRAPGPEESITEYAYDCNGNLEKIWDANHPSAGKTAPPTTVNAYDALNRLETVTQPWAGAGGGDTVTSYGYDVQDHLTQVTDAEGNATTYEYSDRDLLTEQISPVQNRLTAQDPGAVGLILDLSDHPANFGLALRLGECLPAR